jgi:hypothetical protein
MPRLSKKKWMARHSRRNAFERYGVNLDQNTEKRIVDLIQSGNPEKARHVSSSSVARRVWDVLLDDTWMRVVYDKQRKCLVTVLRREPDQTETA